MLLSKQLQLVVIGLKNTNRKWFLKHICKYGYGFCDNIYTNKRRGEINMKNKYAKIILFAFSATTLVACGNAVWKQYGF